MASLLRPGPEVVSPPALEPEQRPNDCPAVSNAAYVVDHQSANHLRVEHTPGAHPAGREHLSESAGEGTTEPGAERHAKAVFPPGEDLGREAVGHCFLEEALEPEEPRGSQGRRDAA